MAKGEAESEIFAEETVDKLLSRCGSDAVAFSVLYDIYYEKIFSYCIARVQIRQVGQDLTSETFITAAENASRFGGKKRIEFINWLYAIATTKVNAYLKKPQTISQSALYDDVLKLTLKEQAVIAFRFFENLTVDRIADITGSTPNKVRLEIAKAIEKLKLCDTENQLAALVKELHIDRTPDEGHKEKLRTRIIISFNTARLKRYQFLFYFLAALVILIITGSGLWVFSGSQKPPLLLQNITRKSPAAEANFPLQGMAVSRLEKIRQLAKEKNIAALLDILKGDDLPAKLLAAKYLAELTDANTADILRLAAPAMPSAQKNEQKTLLIETIDKKTKQPLAGVSLAVQFDEKKESKFLSDSNGRVLLDLPAGPVNQLQIYAKAKGYAAMKFQPFELTGQKSILFEMPRVSTIGGLVVDEQLGGIENAEIRIHTESGQAQEQLFAPDEILKTDANGIWRCRSFPQDAEKVLLTITHPDYISQDSSPAVVEQLQNLSYLTILEKGIAAGGAVLDWNKKPLPAIVSRGTSYETGNSTICDANGKFRFGNLPQGKEIFTAQCRGAAPGILEISVEPNMPAVIFNLQPPKTIRAKVVDAAGTPVKDVSVRVSGWHGFETLDFETTTDENGFFQWTSAPADEVLFDFYKHGFEPIGDFGMTSDNDYVITLERQ